MENKRKKKIEKYMSLYMSIGMCLGVSAGLIYGMYFFPDNQVLGLCLGMPIGMSLGMSIGAAKDKRLSENMMELIRMEAVDDSSDMVVYVVDKNGEGKQYRVLAKKMKEEKFAVGDRVAEEKDGTLVSLESK